MLLKLNKTEVGRFRRPYIRGALSAHNGGGDRASINRFNPLRIASQEFICVIDSDGRPRKNIRNLQQRRFKRVAREGRAKICSKFEFIACREVHAAELNEYEDVYVLGEPLLVTRELKFLKILDTYGFM